MKCIYLKYELLCSWGYQVCVVYVILQGLHIFYKVLCINIVDLKKKCILCIVFNCLSHIGTLTLYFITNTMLAYFLGLISLGVQVLYNVCLYSGCRKRQRGKYIHLVQEEQQTLHQDDK